MRDAGSFMADQITADVALERQEAEDTLLTIRKARLSDVPAIFQLINYYVHEQVVLPRTPSELYEHIWEFTVAEQDGVFVGCGGLKFYSAELAEIRSLCVSSEIKSKGVGRAIVESLLNEAEERGLKKVFALTTSPGFFGKLGFAEASRETLPMKIWRDCLHCTKYFNCVERTFVLDLPRRIETTQLSQAIEVPVASGK
jgi:amino-acid N-acetyltransferase